MTAVGTRRIAAIATEYVRARSFADVPLDMAAPTMAFTSTGVIDVWLQSDWVGNTVTVTEPDNSQSFYRDHQILIGPDNGGNILPRGSYRVWRQLTDLPEVPISVIGTLIIY